jgi:ABC transport system ATP-binding/permease protein
MWKLVIEDDEGDRTEVPLRRATYAIGRGARNDIRLTDRNVSREHALLRRSDAAYEIEDLDSYNGTHINGARANVARTLVAGDVIQLGDYVLAIDVDESGAAEIAPAARAPNARPARLVVTSGAPAGTELALVDDDVVVGRDESAGLALVDASVSRRHCRMVRIDARRFDVIDLGSSNGVRINGVELRRGVLEPGDALEVGDVKMRYVGAGEVHWPAVATDGKVPKRKGRAVAVLVVVLAVIALALTLVALKR